MGNAIQRLLQTVLQAKGIMCHEVQFRVKSSDSALAKTSRHPDRYPSVADLTDLLGLRVTTYFSDDVDKVAELFRSEFLIDAVNSVDKRESIKEDQFGYISLHFVAELSAARSGLVEYRPFRGRKFELQIRSVLQDAWAEIEHDLGYKADVGLPRELRRRFSRVAGLLEIADAEFVGLRNELLQHVSDVEQRIDQDQGADELELDQVTVAAIIEADRDLAHIDAEIAAALGVELESTVNGRYAAARARDLQEENVHTIGDLRGLLEERRPVLREFARSWLEATGAEMGDREVSRGITLFYLQLSILGDRSEDYLRSLKRFERNPEMVQLLRSTWSTSRSGPRDQSNDGSNS
jgi:ppGpp synthetase/RelA/SpoT-type nucleotidyltranferase